MSGKLYDALISDGVEPTFAREAAEEVARVKAVDPLDNIQRDARVLIWMVAVNIVLSIAILFAMPP